MEKCFEPLQDFIFHESPQYQVEDLPTFWMDDQIDLTWLSTLPFELSSEELTGALW